MKAGEERWEQAVHPRVCGEQVSSIICSVSYRGSSPRVRGTDNFRIRQAIIGRFIPACAGNSTVIRRRVAGCAVHPRVCGEQLLLSKSIKSIDGSSPRVRGTVNCDFSCTAPERFIPACAGNSW